MSSSKALYTWTTRDAIQEAREACGGHGYLKAANIGELRNNHDPTVTYEGDNNVLGQQASNWLLRQWNDKVESPFGTAKFINNRNDILKNSYKKCEKLMQHEASIECKFLSVFSLNFEFFKNFSSLVVFTCYEWLMCWLLETTSTFMNAAKQEGINAFKARNDSQVYKARDLSRAYAEYYALQCFTIRLESPEAKPELITVLRRIQLLYGLWCLDKHMATFYQGNFASGSAFGDYIRNQLLTKCKEIKDDAVAIADSLAPPDWVLNSVLGKSDGKVSF